MKIFSPLSSDLLSPFSAALRASFEAGREIWVALGPDLDLAPSSLDLLWQEEMDLADDAWCSIISIIGARISSSLRIGPIALGSDFTDCFGEESAMKIARYLWEKGIKQEAESEYGN